ncbi:MAG: hypothetical protein V4449_01710 [Patescibacteria group bacterium]
MSHEQGHDEDWVASYGRDAEAYTAYKAKLVSADLRRKLVNAARISIWTLLGIAGGAVAGTAMAGPIGMAVGTVTGGIGGFELGGALVRSENKK